MSNSITIEQLLEMVVEKNASDLHLHVGRPPVLRVDGRLRTLNTPDLTPDDTRRMMEVVTTEEQRNDLENAGGTDFGFAFGEKARFRVAIDKEKGRVGVTLRLIPSKLMSFEQIGLPESVKNLCMRPRGLILITGPTGCGKTTTLATMIDFINTEIDRHIVTVEDPIEYFHNHKKSIITQREIGVDVPGFAEGIRRGLRQDPDVFLVGEMRDLETIGAAITAAETGHLVFATLHTTGAARTVDRIIDAFPTNQQEQIRTQLSVSLISVISQVLMPRAEGHGRVAGFEIMVTTDAIANQIRENKTYHIPSAIQTGKQYGMILLDDHLHQLFKQKAITYNEAMAKAQNPADLQVKIKEGIEGAQKLQQKKKK